MKTKQLLIAIFLSGALLLGACNSRYRVGALQNEFKSVELGNARSVTAKINFGAGDLFVTGGSQKLLEADFAYNVAQLKPEVKYTNGTLVVQQPEVRGLPDLRDITNFQNKWDLRLNDEVPMDLSVDMGAGGGTLQLDGLSLSGLNISFGAGIYTLDLSGDWARDLDITIDAGAAFLTVRLPRDVGARVKVESGPHTIDATGLTKDGEVYTNAAYDVSDVTLHIDLQAGIGTITLVEIE